jgi:hypothetical protein
MRAKLQIVIFFFFCKLTLLGQNCVDSQLSNSLLFTSEIISKSNEKLGACKIIITISDKNSGKRIQVFEIESEFILINESFINCDFNKSFITGKNLHIKAIENDYGNLIVADFNFDNKEDFAVKREEGGNGGPLYNFYIQDENNKFLLDDFLSNTMVWFPFEINKAEETLSTYIRMNSLEEEKLVYKYYSQSGEWKLINKRTYRN